ncbi:MAG TPA: ASPIC/UnbV domain-containing protein, partial [Kofleriaceae bacterium]|nr:ASPIC/UnbV domain-containing protein [Kofleriaceae bacterium]
DLDGDGDQDLLVAQSNGPLVLFENRGMPRSGSWLDVLPVGRASNRSGVGAIVTAQLASGRTLVKPVGAGGILNAASPPEAFFGLGDEIVTSVDVRWPSGTESQLSGPLHGKVVVTEP